MFKQCKKCMAQQKMKVKIIYTLKPKHFSEDSDISNESFQSLLKKLSNMDHEAFVAENFGDD